MGCTPIGYGRIVAPTAMVVRADRVDGDGRRDTGVFTGRAVRRRHHRAAAPVLVLAWSGLRGSTRAGGWAAVVGVGVFLGFAALFYTLLLAYSAFTLTIMAVAVAIGEAQLRDPLLRLGPVAGIAGAIALIGWLPYLLAAVGGSSADSGTATHYLPSDGAQLSFPMFEFTLLGALCMLGHAVAGGPRAAVPPAPRASRSACSRSTPGRCCRC